ncbi:SGNH/GDSL hydrolase family protein [Streptomyces sp. NPDC001089]
MTHHISLPDDRVAILGALDLERIPDGVRPRRLPARTRLRLHDGWMNLVVSHAATVRLRLRTAARSLTLGVHVTVSEMNASPLPASFDLAIDGTVLTRVPATAGDVLSLAVDLADARLTPGPAETVRFDDLPAGVKDVEIWLPHSATVELRTLGSDAPVLAPTPPPGLAWVHYGSSFSHGLEAPAPTLTWPAVAALTTGASLTNLGFTGDAMLDPEVARAIRDTSADLITLKVASPSSGRRRCESVPSSLPCTGSWTPSAKAIPTDRSCSSHRPLSPNWRPRPGPSPPTRTLDADTPRTPRTPGR